MQQNPENPISDVVILSSDDEEEDNQITPNNSQIVLYDPTSNGSESDVFEPDPIRYMPPSLIKPSISETPKVLPSIRAFTVQCARCFKWRLIPSKEKYEEIREHILEIPFMCELAQQWRPEICCDEPGDVEQDESLLWAIDKPSIAQPPPGWERDLRIRGQGSYKFADVYYIAPSGKRLRSIVEIQKYLLAHPDLMAQGVTLSQFSFKVPRPLQENYVRKRSRSLTAPGEQTALSMARQANALPWSSPHQLMLPQLTYSTNLELDMSPANKKARPSVEHNVYDSDTLHTRHRFNM